MFDALRHSMAIRKLQRDRARTERLYAQEMPDGNSKEDREKRSEIASVMFHELDVIDEELYKLVTARLLDEADRYFLPRPRYGDKEKWIESDLTGARFLSKEAMKELRDSVRQERSARIAPIAIWTGVASGLFGAFVGIIGTVIAVLAYVRPPAP